MATVLTGATGHILIAGKVCGFVKNMTFDENIGRGEVQGIGRITLQQVPVQSIRCSFSADLFFISFKTDEMKALLNRTGSLEQFKNQLIYGGNGLTIEVYKKESTIDSATKLVTSVKDQGELIGKIDTFYVNSQSFSISDGAISSSSVRGVYLEPIVLNKQ